MGEAGRPYLFPESARLARDNVVLHACARRHVVQRFAGPLSIKTVVHGEVSWHFQNREVRVGADSFLVLTPGEPYSMNIEAHSPVETCCAFFRAGFAESIAHDSTTPVQQSLDDPRREAPALQIISALHPSTSSPVRRGVQRLADRCASQLRPSAFEEEFFTMALALLQLEDLVKAQRLRVPAAKQATRAEVYRRLLIAREYLHGQIDSPVSLEQAAKAACLSIYHFHRSFRCAFGKTPHAYVTGVRLSRAHSLLTRGASVLDTCLAVGFSSPTSFSRLFRTFYGMPPSLVSGRAFRKIGSASRRAAE